jgi:hypothetical protein
VKSSRGWVLWAIIAVAVVGSVVLFGRQGPGTPLDPRSTKPDGAKALVYLLEEYGVTVDLTSTVPRPGSTDRVLVLVDRLSAVQHDALTDFVDAGGQLVVADPSSPLGLGGHDGIDLSGIGTELDPGLCTVTALRTIDAIELTAGSASLPVRGEDTSCFGSRLRAYVVVHGEGDGMIVALGGATQWTNNLLDNAANAGLATMLLAPATGGRVVVLGGDGAGGEKGLFDLVPNRVWFAIGQVGMGFVVLALWRARRLGRVVVEAQPVEIAGSELVVASGRILDRIGQPQRAAEVLQRELVNDLTSRFGARAGTDADTLDATVSASGRIPPGTVIAVLGQRVNDERALVALAERVDAIRKEVL